MQYRIVRSKRKTVALEISRTGEVLVRAPHRMDVARIEAFVTQHEAWIKEKSALVEERLRRHPQPTAEEEKALRRRAKEYLPPRVAAWAERMGVTYSGIKINFAATRFGSCNGTNGLNFSARVMQYSPRAIDYVIVHELAHTKEHNHSPRFWAMVARYMPDYREAEKELKG